jgi:hypothetical protein
VDGKVRRSIGLASRAAESALGGHSGDCSRLARVWHARLLVYALALGAATACARGQAAWAAAQAAEAACGPEGAAPFVERIITDTRLSGEVLFTQPAAAAWLVRTARALGDEDVASRYAARAGAVASGPGLRAIQAAARARSGPVEQGPPIGPAQHGNLVPQHEQLDVLGSR